MLRVVWRRHRGLRWRKLGRREPWLCRVRDEVEGRWREKMGLQFDLGWWWDGVGFGVGVGVGQGEVGMGLVCEWRLIGTCLARVGKWRRCWDRCMGQVPFLWFQDGSEMLVWLQRCDDEGG